MPNSPPSAPAPYSDLTPAVVLDALDSVGLRGDGRLIQLNSYENRVFQVFLEDGRVVVPKFYRPSRWSDAQILEEHSFATELLTQEIPVVAPWPLMLVADADGKMPTPCTLASFRTGHSMYRFSVTERRSGRAPELEDPAVLEWLGRFIGRLHAIGAQSQFKHRVTLTPQTFGADPREWLLASEMIPPDAVGAWKEAADQVLKEVDRRFEAAGALRYIRLHGDCHVGNVLWTETGPHFVDLDDAMNGPAVQDLWMLLSGDASSMRRQLSDLLAGYEDFMAFDRREVPLIEALRSLRMIHYSAWIARRWADPAFPVAFPWFGSSAYWHDQTTRLREQLQTMREQASDEDLLPL